MATMYITILHYTIMTPQFILPATSLYDTSQEDIELREMREFTGKALQQLGEIVTARPHLGDTARHLLSQVKHKITTPLTANTVTVGTDLHFNMIQL